MPSIQLSVSPTLVVSIVRAILLGICLCDARYEYRQSTGMRARAAAVIRTLIWEDGVYVGDPTDERRADEASGQRAPPSEAHAHAPARAQPATWQAEVL